MREAPPVRELSSTKQDLVSKGNHVMVILSLFPSKQIYQRILQCITLTGARILFSCVVALSAISKKSAAVGGFEEEFEVNRRKSHLNILAVPFIYRLLHKVTCDEYMLTYSQEQQAYGLLRHLESKTPHLKQCPFLSTEECKEHKERTAAWYSSGECI
jgi:hypothetical protein